MSAIIETYWNTYFGKSEEAQALVQYLAADASGDLKSADGVIEVHKIFADLGLDELSGNYTDTELEGFGDAYLVVAALAVLMAENKAQGAVQFASLGVAGGASDGASDGAQEIRLHTESKENTQINTALKYFALSPEDHAVADRFDEDELSEFADLSEQLRGQLD
ncbi:imm68 putative immunity domain-containing protein [Corynebacterium callunae]|uniref:imm68 putative immunity domain-containing protein n=1 Tax=Corynebacterium callunae TaxID=1721 RepID=UPI003982268B